ncbi:MAG: hypothetical protein U0871_29890 [Gemmataceae bacterium]
MVERGLAQFPYDDPQLAAGGTVVCHLHRNSNDRIAEPPNRS